MWAVRSTKGCARDVTTKCSAWQKSSRNQDITHRIGALWVKGTLSMDSLNLGETGLLDKKSRNLVEWDTFRLWLVIACNGQNRCDKSTAQRFWTAIVRAMGQQKRSKRTTSNSIDRFWNQTCPIFLKAQRRFYIQNPLHKKKPLHKTVFTQKTFTQKNFDTEKLVRTDCTKKFLHTETFTRKTLPRAAFTKKFFRTEAFTQKSLRTTVFTRTLLHTDAFIYTTNFYTQKLVHTARFYTERLCVPFLIT